MKILVVCQYFYPEQFRINAVCFGLVEMGHDVTVLTGLPNYPSGIVHSNYKWGRKRRENINGVEVIRAPLVGRGKGTFQLSLNYLSFALTASVKALFLQRDFDVIFVYQLSPITMAIPASRLKKLTGRPMLLYCLDLWPESISAAGIGHESSVYRVLLPMSRSIYKSADRIAVSSRMFEKYFEDTIGFDRSITYLPAYAESLFEGIEPNQDNSGITNLVFAGNIGEMQSVETIIMAAGELRECNDIKWHIIGSGSALERCKMLAREMELNNITFYGQRHISEMPLYYSMADAFLVTLKANRVISYTLPGKVQSYMAAGKPIIGAIDGETRMVIDEADCGLCCAAEDYGSLARIVKDFAQHKDKHLYYGANARAYYDEHFRKEDFMEKLVKLLKETKEGVC